MPAGGGSGEAGRTHAVRVHAPGGPEALRWEEVALPPVGAGEVLLRHTAVGVNFIDVYHRTGLYPLPLPTGVGLEAAGVVEAVGPGVHDVAVGDRVAYGTGPVGAYAARRVVPAALLVPLPAELSDETGAAMMLKGLTVWYLLHRTRPLRAGDTVLLHAAAGGVGLLFCQWARSLGLRVIGTVGSDEKAALARAHGCAETVVYTREDVVARVRALTDGAGVPVVFDSVGKDTFAASLDCLAPLGLLVSFGQSSGSVPPFELRTLADKGSLSVTRTTLRTHTSRREDLLAGARELVGRVVRGEVRVLVGQRFPLADAAAAHRALEGRATTGSTVLVP